MSIKYVSSSNIVSKDIPDNNTYIPNTTYTRPSDWLTIPTVGPTEQKFAGLYAVYPSDVNLIAISVTLSAGTYTVDWGDGTSNTGTGTNNHVYNYDTLSSTVSSRGYKMAIVTITPTGGNITGIALNVRYPNGTSVTPTNPGYMPPWLDINLGSPFLTSLVIGNFAVSTPLLERFNLVSMSNTLTSFTPLFYNCTSLQSVSLPNTQNITSTDSMFQLCTSLRTIPYMDTSNVTTMYNMFQTAGVYNIPNIDTSKVSNMANMFVGCASLISVPYLNTSNVTNMAFMFSGCSDLQNVPQFDMTKVTNSISMYNATSSLDTSISITNLSNCTIATNMFNGSFVNNVTINNASNITNTVSMFASCTNLNSVSITNMSSVANASLMFNGCTSVTSVSIGNTVLLSNTNSMFNGCSILKDAPNLVTSNVTDMGSMFSSCKNLVTVPTYDTSKTTTTASMFNACATLKDVPTFNTINVTTMTNMFNGAKQLQSIPSFNTSNVTIFSGFTTGCTALSSFPTLNTSKAANITNMFPGTSAALGYIPSIDCSNVAGAGGGIIGVNPSMYSVGLSNMGVTFTMASTSLSKNKIESVFSAGLKGATAQTITITGCTGVDTAISKTGTWTSGANTITANSNTSLSTGMYVYGIGGTVGCGFNSTTDYLNVTSGYIMANGTAVTFPTTQNGVTANTLYYIINVNGSLGGYNTFQISTTVGGSPVDITANTGMNISYSNKINNIAGSVLTMDNTLSNSGTAAAITSRQLNTYLATLKGWTVTG